MKNMQTLSEARIDAVAQLMLLTARPSLTSRQVAVARGLIDQIRDWDEYLTFSRINASAPFFYHHAQKHDLLSEHPDILKRLRAIALQSVATTGGLRDALLRFHDSCIMPNQARHLYVKGPVLGELYYDEPNLRISSDIDVLVDARDFRSVAASAVASGYRFLVETNPVTFATTNQDIDFIIRNSDVISAIDEYNCHIEIHRHLEKTTAIFPEREILSSSITTSIRQREVSTLSTSWHFCYIVYHHARHFWCLLHWVADLHALMQSSFFDRDEVLRLAERLGIAPSVAAAIEFAGLTDRPEDWPQVLGVTPAGVFLDACLRGLPGDHAFERLQWKNMFLFDFGDLWQINKKMRLRFWAKSAFRRMRPNLSQYLQNRRPRALEWIYTIESIGALARNLVRHLKLGGGGR